MKKFIIAIMVLACAGAFAGDVYKTIALTTTGTTTADAVYEVPAGERLSLLGVYQGATGAAGQTNTCVVKCILNGLTSTEAVTLDTLAAVGSTNYVIEAVGEGDVTADVDDIILIEGDSFWLDGSGHTSTGLVYKLIVKKTKQ
jgi:hypothetical protein